MSDCPSLLKPKPSGLNVCTSEICFDANFTCLNIPLGANLSQALQIMETALCWNGTLPSCISVETGATISDVIEVVAEKACSDEHFGEGTVSDFTWDATDQVVTGMSHTLVGSSGSYAVHVHLRNRYKPNGSGTMKLFVGGVEVITWGPNEQGGLGGGETDFIQITDSFVWRGSVDTGQTIEVKVTSTTPSKIATFNYSWIILKN